MPPLYRLWIGVQLVATAHGNELENLVKNPSMADLVGGIQVRSRKLDYQQLDSQICHVNY